MTWIEHNGSLQRTMKRALGTIADCDGHCLLATVLGTSPPLGTNPAGARLLTALPRILAGANEGY